MSKTKVKRFEITYVYLVAPYYENKQVIYATSQRAAKNELFAMLEEKVNLNECSEPFDKKNVSISSINYMDIE